MKLIGQTMLDRQFALDASATVDMRVGPDETTHLVQWNEGVSVGEVVVEAAPNALYAGSWHRLATISFEGTSPKADLARLPGHYSAIRHRIAVPVDGDGVTTKIEGHGSW